MNAPHHYSTATPVAEPVEIRISRRASSTSYKIEILTASVTDAGIIRYSLTSASGDTSLALSNLQAKIPYPRKAVKGWQLEVIEFAESGLGSVAEIR